MHRRSIAALAVAVSGLLVAGLSGCGNQVTANRDWVGYGGYVLISHGPKGRLAAGDNFLMGGYLTDANGKAMLDRPYQETCSVVFPGSGQPGPMNVKAPEVAAETVGGGGVWNCLFILDAGDRVYVATGAEPFGQLNSVTGPSNQPAATITLTSLDKLPTKVVGGTNIHLRISARLPGKG